jgi:hypothetical protein
MARSSQCAGAAHKGRVGRNHRATTSACANARGERPSNETFFGWPLPAEEEMMRAVAIFEADRRSRTSDAEARVLVLQRRVEELRTSLREAEAAHAEQAARARRALQAAEATRRELAALRAAHAPG